MSASTELIQAIKAELKAAGVTYAELAQRLNMAESSVKRMFAKADMPLSRIDAIWRCGHKDTPRQICCFTGQNRINQAINRIKRQ